MAEPIKVGGHKVQLTPSGGVMISHDFRDGVVVINSVDTPLIADAIGEITGASKSLREAAANVLHDIDDLVANSQGVTGLHMNGEVAEWHSLMSGGSFEAWLRSVEVLRAALTPTADKE